MVRDTKAPSIIKREHDEDAVAKRTVMAAIPGRSISYEDPSFVTGESPAIHDVNNDLGRNSRDGYIANDGDGNFTIEISNDGINYGGLHTLQNGELMKLRGVDIDRIRITWVADSSYRIFVI